MEPINKPETEQTFKEGVTTGNRTKIVGGAVVALLILLGLGSMMNNKDGEVMSDTNVDIATSSTSTEEMAPSLSAIDAALSATNQDDVVGKNVVFTDVEVTNVSSDRVFTVKDSSGIKEITVVLDRSLDAGDAEDVVVIKKGQHLMIDGEFKTSSSYAPSLNITLTDADKAMIKASSLIIHAENVSQK